MKTIVLIAKWMNQNLLTIHQGANIDKILASFKLAFAPTFLILIMETFTDWYIDNQKFMVFVFVAIAIDHLLGTIVHAFHLRDFSMKKNAVGLITKTGLCISAYVLFTMIHEIIHEADFIQLYFKMMLQLVVIIYPAGSAMGNMSILTNGKFPPIGWMKKLSKFNEDLDPSIFKPTKDEKDNNNNSL